MGLVKFAGRGRCWCDFPALWRTVWPNSLYKATRQWHKYNNVLQAMQYLCCIFVWILCRIFSLSFMPHLIVIMTIIWWWQYNSFIILSDQLRHRACHRPTIRSITADPQVCSLQIRNLRVTHNLVANQLEINAL